jgi:hypothetical protein
MLTATLKPEIVDDLSNMNVFLVHVDILTKYKITTNDIIFIDNSVFIKHRSISINNLLLERYNKISKLTNTSNLNTDSILNKINILLKYKSSSHDILQNILSNELCKSIDNSILNTLKTMK